MFVCYSLHKTICSSYITKKVGVMVDGAGPIQIAIRKFIHKTETKYILLTNFQFTILAAAGQNLIHLALLILVGYL